MNYLNINFQLKLKKVFRYLKLYGFKRTWIKIQGQRHLQTQFNSLPKITAKIKPKQRVAIVGCGNFAFTTIAYYLKKNFGNVIAGVMDININRAASLAHKYRVPVFSDNIDDILKLEQVELVFIASDHATHAEYAIKAIGKGKQVYIEKPHVVSERQLEALYEIMNKNKPKVFLGFNRPVSRLGQLIFKYLNGQPGSGIYNWFVVGHKLEKGHWYLNLEQGGRVLGNLCHWTDFILHLISKDKIFPVEINPTRGAKKDSDIAISFKFNDESIGVITFSEKGETFEGVREKFNAQKGDCILTLDDFQKLTVDVGPEKIKYKLFHRDQGHEANIVNAYNAVFRKDSYNYEQNYLHIYNTAKLFLKTKEALERNEKIIVM